MDTRCSYHDRQGVAHLGTSACGLRWGLKGRNSIAQGKALGTDHTSHLSPEGATLISNRRVSPFQGYHRVSQSLPRAMPWAIEFQPFGPKRSNPPTRIPINRPLPDGRGTARTNPDCGPIRFASSVCFLGSTGLTVRLMNYGSLRSILTDVAADMPNVRDTRIARKTPVLREVRIARTAAVVHSLRDSRNGRSVTVVPLVPKNSVRRSEHSVRAGHAEFRLCDNLRNLRFNPH